MSTHEKIVNWLFETQAIRVSPADQPFWYAAGTLGPFYVNTHFLYGSEAEANQLLAQIEGCLSRPLELAHEISAAVRRQYGQNAIYRELCDLMAEQLQDAGCDLVSGGERRDYFFSFMAATLLNKPHLTLFKDGKAVLSDMAYASAHLVQPDELRGQNTLHVVDLVTEASSYQRAWLPAIKACGAAMPLTLAIIDRNQGGREYLASVGTRFLALGVIGRPLFESALAKGLISDGQFAQIERYQHNPQAYMEQFIHEHPSFLEQQVALGGKSRERALLFIEKNPALAGKG